MPNPAASPAVSSTVGLKNMVIAPLTVDTEETLTYGDLQLVAGAIEASITPQNADPDVQYFDDQEGDVLYPDPELSFKTKLADLPLIIQEMIFANKIDDNGVLIRSSTDKPPYFAVGFKSEKANHKYRYVWLYKVRAKPVTENYATKEGKLRAAIVLIYIPSQTHCNLGKAWISLCKVNLLSLFQIHSHTFMPLSYF